MFRSVSGLYSAVRDNDRTGLNLAVGPKTPGFTAIGIFLFFGAIMASLAATSLLWRGTALDPLWALNPIAYKQLAPLGSTVGILFLLLCATLTTAGVGWFRRRLWGWRPAVAIIGTRVLLLVPFVRILAISNNEQREGKLNTERTTAPGEMRLPAPASAQRACVQISAV